MPEPRADPRTAPELRHVEGIFGPYRGTMLMLPSDQADQAIADLWARERYAPDYPQVRDYTEEEIASATQAAWSFAAGAAGVAPPVLESIDPTTAELGAADVTLSCRGSGFTPQSVIMFAGQPEPIVFVSAEEVTTVVKPSLPWGAVTVPVLVRNAGVDSATLSFTFTEQPVSRRAEEDSSRRRGRG